LGTLLAFDSNVLVSFKQAQQDQFEPQVSLEGLIGLDEVGRGSLMGPVVAAALILPAKLTRQEQVLLDELDDSKASHYTHTKRVQLSQALKETGAWGIGEASSQEVDTLNIYRASHLACHRALIHLQQQYAEVCPALNSYLLLMDGNQKLSHYSFSQIPLIHADAQSACVAGASVIAKAYRDELVKDLSQAYPIYGWDKNCGYGTKRHLSAIRLYGATPLHRQTFKPLTRISRVTG
jgi:ribonuclease HII